MPIPHVLWTGRQSVVLSWETVVWDPRFNGIAPTLTTQPYGNVIGGPATKRLTVNARGVVQPVTREFLVYQDQILDRSRFTDGFFPTIPGFTVAVVGCTDGAGRADPANLPVPLDQNCAKRSASTPLCLDGVGAQTFAPMTVVGCRVPVTVDTSLRLEFVDAANLDRTVSDVVPGVGHDPLPLLPHVKIVTGERILKRAFAFGGETCSMRPVGGGNPVDCNQTHLDRIQLWRMCRHEIPVVPPISCSPLPPGMSTDLAYDALQSEWAWSVEDQATKRWKENFTEDLRVEFVKLLVTKRDGSTRYVAFEEVRFLDVGNRRCQPEAEAGTGHVRVNTVVCENVRLDATPAWGSAMLSVPLVWRVRLIARAQDNVTMGSFVGTGVLVNDLAALPTDQLFIEFHVVKFRP
jgi:hypothetical protein